MCTFDYGKKSVTYLMDMALIDDGTGKLDGFGFLEAILPKAKKKGKQFGLDCDLDRAL